MTSTEDIVSSNDELDIEIDEGDIDNTNDTSVEEDTNNSDETSNGDEQSPIQKRIMENTNKPNVEDLTEKQKYINEFRKKFCIRKEFSITKNIIDEEGFLNQEYFRPKLKDLQQSHQQKVKQMELKTWNENSKQKLILGIQEFGIGSFKEISDKYLPDWSVNELRLKATRLIGRQNLQLYRGYKGSAEEIQKEWKFNYDLATRFNCWKNSVLVYDDEGHILKELNKHHNISS